MTRKRTTENEAVVSGSAAPARRKTTRPRTTRAAAASEPAPAVEPAPAAAPVIAHAAPSQTTSSVTTAKPAVHSIESSQDKIARLAYSYWEARGRQGGSPEEDWLRAEAEIRGRSASR
jgi:Protein of unknown function (DUF2934)